MSNSNKEDFERMVQLAEFGARRHDERRQIEFRVFIAYNTLLVLTFYQLEKIERLGEPLWVTIGLVAVHLTYLLWQLRLSRALVNDANRRDFYLKKAECILHHLREKPDTHFCPRKDVYLTIRLEPKKGRISEEKDRATEYALFKGHEPDIVLISPMWKVWKHWGQLISDWSRPFQILIPTVMIFFLILALIGNAKGDSF